MSADVLHENKVMESAVQSESERKTMEEEGHDLIIANKRLTPLKHAENQENTNNSLQV